MVFLLCFVDGIEKKVQCYYGMVISRALFLFGTLETMTDVFP